MAELVLTTFRGVYHYSNRYRLDGEFYRVGFHWNPRARDGVGLWMFDLFDSKGDSLLRSVSLALGQDIIRGYGRFGGLPPGKFHVRDTEGTGVESGPDELGGRVLVIYEEAATS